MTVAPMLPIPPERSEWTVDDLGELPEDLPYELVNGRLIVPSPTALHQDLCVELLLALRVNCPPDYLVSIDLSMRIDRRNEPRPDVVAIRREHANRSPVPVEDALLAVEVISPTSTFRDLYDKAKVYAHAGVRSYWVVDPLHEKMTLTEYALSASGDYEVTTHTEDLFVSERPWKVSVDLPALTVRRAGLLARDGQ
ncbi:Uma2 family endonuclease [Verrucosispora sp. WMMA2044]|uniref:Uma2 family endonuclease n=1 Tax=Verrucosispora sioxanthis TaxID=2499994 RepID=A0A6M1L164_9ACTN|nr:MULTISPECIES: Uma2 family endonuclease [Micromonospora]NEE62761.1 Uma2 family endonuclease [Verrucosispora sioxanthis]NGM11871.1 Uma2 family endonuclease [Verrucosispora sioxanthis]WBB47131.1 Uma2 family endonuclease [Verrucosispora sp. WMMA2044]